MNLLLKLKTLEEKFEKINSQLSDPGNLKDQQKLISLSKERSELREIMESYSIYKEVLQNLDGNREIIETGTEGELVELAQSEMSSLLEKKAELESRLKLLLIPKDPNDSKNIIIEIRAGTGGDEAALFANDLFRMYSRYAEKRNWHQELIDISESGGLGGIKEVVFSISGENVYGELKFESGVHRVQRVPLTEASGRIHTSAASVVVMPEAEDVQIAIDPNDLRIDVFRSGGAGGQNVNKVETAIRITHLPSGIVVQCQDERSQLKNRQKAMRVLRTRLLDLKQKEKTDVIAAQRKSIVRSGDRSDKIRTYNYPQNRVTDHRIALTLYNLSNIMDGEMDELIDKLKFEDIAERIKSMNGN